MTLTCLIRGHKWEPAGCVAYNWSWPQTINRCARCGRTR